MRAKAKQLPKFRSLFLDSAKVLKRNWKLLGGISLVYGAVYLLFAKGVSSLDLDGLKTSIETNLGVSTASFGGRFLLASVVLQESGSLSETGTVFMFFISMVTVLALIWAFRHIWSNKTTTVKAAFYQGMYPLVPFVLMMVRAIVQLLPVLTGAYILGLGINNETFISGTEKFWFTLLLLVVPAIWSIRMLLNTTFGLIIVTIPKMTPQTAYREAKILVKPHRAYLVRQFLAFGFSLLILATGLMLVFLKTVPGLAPIMGLLFTIIFLPFFMTFTYSLYRKLL